MSDELPEDFVDLVACLRAEGCELIVVGAHALAAHGAPRATGDLDIFVRPDPVNAERVYRALVRFGAAGQALQRSATKQRMVAAVVALIGLYELAAGLGPLLGLGF